MGKFKDFGISIVTKVFTGDKIKISRVLNREITVHDYKIEESKFTESGNGKCLYLQISIGDVKHVLFSGSQYLMQQIQLVPAEGFPFTTTIIEDNESYQFS